MSLINLMEEDIKDGQGRIDHDDPSDHQRKVFPP